MLNYTYIGIRIYINTPLNWAMVVNDLLIYYLMLFVTLRFDISACLRNSSASL